MLQEPLPKELVQNFDRQLETSRDLGHGGMGERVKAHGELGCVPLAQDVNCHGNYSIP